MFCYNCGKELPKNAAYCPGCGAQVGKAEAKEKDEIKKKPVVEPAPVCCDAECECDREPAPKAVSGFVWSMIAMELFWFPILGFVFALIGLIKSIKSRSIIATDRDHYKLKGMATVGLVVGILNVIFSSLVTFVFWPLVCAGMIDLATLFCWA